MKNKLKKKSKFNLENIIYLILNVPFLISLHISFLIWIICSFPMFIFLKGSILDKYKSGYEDLILNIF